MTADPPPVTDLGDVRHARATGGWHVTPCTCAACGRPVVVVSPGPARFGGECPCGARALYPDDAAAPANGDGHALRP